jgi:hypothetical protein
MPKKIVFEPATEIKVTGIISFLKRKVTCPKEYLGKTVYLVIVNEPYEPAQGSQQQRASTLTEPTETKPYSSQTPSTNTLTKKTQSGSSTPSSTA